MNLRFEKFEEKHIPIYYAWRNDPEVAIYDQAAFLRPMAFAEVEEWCQILVTGLTFVAYEGDIPIGTIALMNHSQRNRFADLAIVIGNKDYWSKGYGTAMLTQLLDWAFEGMNLHRVGLEVFDFNKRAIGLYEKMGFVHEGTKREMLYRHGVYGDILSYGMLKSEYLNRK